MPTEFDASAHRQLGELVAGFRAMQESMRRIEEGAVRAEIKSDASRAAVHRRMDDLVDRMGDVESSVSTVESDVKEMKPVTEDVRRWKLMGIGALAATGMTSAALGVTFANAAKRIFAIITGG